MPPGPILLDPPLAGDAALRLGLVFLALTIALAFLALGRRRQQLKVDRATTTDSGVRLAPLCPHGLVPLLGHTLEPLRHAQRIHDWTHELCEAHAGRPHRIRVLGQPLVTVLNTPALFEDVLKTQFEAFDKGAALCGKLQDLLGHGIFAVDGRPWRHQRKTASHLFTMRALRDSMAHTVHELLPAMHRLLERAATGDNTVDKGSGSLDLVRLLNRFTMEGFAKIGFGIDLGALEAETEHPFQLAFDSAQRLLALRFFVPDVIWKTLRWLNVGPEAELKQHIRVIDETVLDIIAQCLTQRRQMPPAPSSSTTTTTTTTTTIISLFLDNFADSALETLDLVFLRDIVVNFLIAGRDTTAQALCWFFLELGRHPHVERRLREELTRELPAMLNDSASASSSGPPPAPSMADVQRLIYLEAALRETLRLHPSVPANFKEAQRDVVLVDGTFIPRGSLVDVSSYALGRATHVWGPDARDFRPERWLDPADPRRLVPVSAFQFTAFHAGPRMCLGMNLAMMEMKILVASVLSRFRLEMVPGQEITYDLSLTLPVRGQLLVTVAHV